MNDRVPPTAPVPLATLLRHPALGLRQVAGARETDTPVYFVHTSEMEDPVPYLLGGELLLSAGVHCPEAAGAGTYWDRYVARTVQAGAAALGFGIAPVHDTVPRALVEACDRHGLPLVEVDRQTTFTAVASAVWDAIAERRHVELRRVTEAQQSLATAAARPHPVPAVLRQLGQHLGAWTALFGPDGAELAAAGPRPPREARTALGALVARLRSGPSSAAGRATGAAGEELQLAAYGLGGPAGPEDRRLALGVCAPRRDGSDGAIVGVAVVLLSLLTARRVVAAEAERTAALVRLMLGAEPARVAGLLSRSLEQAGAASEGPERVGAASEGPERVGAVSEGPERVGAVSEGPEGGGLWTVVRGRRRGRVRDDGPLATAAFAAWLGTPLVDLDGDALCALVPGEGRIRAQPGWTLGVGAPVPAAELARGDADAVRALRRAVAERVPLVRHGPARAGGVASLVDPDEAGAHGRALLAPLNGAPVLLETLRVWLSLHGGWDRTAVALEVHRNTVRQRIARVEALLEVDLGDADVRMELWFALKWT
ncbi:PucR family transcriptional regulator [Streptomyces sp. RKCA744]|uniref:PucR family transcriptional regulator n=1 Tax=Streptomyces sp. RKCA744 TaxID=2959340 RepID=UPI00209E8F44|nr:PucR family transcriptional regulator [Streptomyces sp. RKCA744]MCO8301649.1 PucR family transcriptional regulator [Streptomyces sp. RKCA744]